MSRIPEMLIEATIAADPKRLNIIAETQEFDDPNENVSEEELCNILILCMFRKCRRSRTSMKFLTVTYLMKNCVHRYCRSERMPCAIHVDEVTQALIDASEGMLSAEDMPKIMQDILNYYCSLRTYTSTGWSCKECLDYLLEFEDCDFDELAKRRAQQGLRDVATVYDVDFGEIRGWSHITHSEFLSSVLATAVEKRILRRRRVPCNAPRPCGSGRKYKN